MEYIVKGGHTKYVSRNVLYHNLSLLCWNSALIVGKCNNHVSPLIFIFRGYILVIFFSNHCKFHETIILSCNLNKMCILCEGLKFYIYPTATCILILFLLQIKENKKWRKS